jgi:ABC-type lipoprotein export system ATPase subunit
LSVLELRGVEREYSVSGRRLSVLRGVSFALRAGEVVWLDGVSGSGKTTVLNVAGLLTRCTRGEVLLAGQVTNGLDDRKLSRLRAHMLGFVFQSHNLLAHFSALENVMLPSLAPSGPARQQAMELLATAGLSDRADLVAARLSGGEQQRVALARALINTPTVVLADEPTAGLDAAAAGIVLAQLRSAARNGRAVLIAAHDRAVGDFCDRRLTIADGFVTEHEHTQARPGAAPDLG